MSITTSAQQILKGVPKGATELPDEYWELVDCYRAELTNQAFAILGRLEDAEDVVQETLCETLRDPAKLAKVRSLGAWLRTINRANALNRSHAQQSRSEVLVRQQQAAPRRMATTGGYSAVEIQESVARAIEGLDSRYRRPLVLRYWEHCSYEEIAARMHEPLGTVKWLLFEAISRMHGRLNGEILNAEKSSSSPSEAINNEEGAQS